MPIKSAKQFRLMAMLAHKTAGKFKGRKMPSPSVAKEMLDKTPHKMLSKFARAKH